MKFEAEGLSKDDAKKKARFAVNGIQYRLEDGQAGAIEKKIMDTMTQLFLVRKLSRAEADDRAKTEMCRLMK